MQGVSYLSDTTTPLLLEHMVCNGTVETVETKLYMSNKP